MHGLRGGLVAGLLFIIPGALVMLGLSFLYVFGKNSLIVDGALYGIKAAVLVIVVEAIIRIGKRGLKTWLLIAIAFVAFDAIYFLALPFPFIVISAAVVGYEVARHAPQYLGMRLHDGPAQPTRPGRWRESMTAIVMWLAMIGRAHV